MSLARIACLCAFNFPYGCMCSTMGMVILPKEAKRLFPDPAIGLGILCSAVGVTQLICPYIGLVSDRCTSRWGRRRPYMIVGTAACIPSLGCMWLSSLWGWPYSYLAGLTLAMTFINVIFSSQCGLVPDLVPKATRGSASGATGLLMLFGAVTGFILIGLTAKWDFRLCYPFYMCILVAGVLIACVSAEELRTDIGSARPPTADVDEKRCVPQVDRAALRGAYMIDTSHEGPGQYDFMWVFVGRMTYYVGISSVAYCQFYVHDMVGVRDDEELRQQMAIIVLIAQVTAATASWPCGILSDKIGRKTLVYISVAFMCFAFGGWGIIPWIFPLAQRIYWVYVGSVLYGCGNGCFLSVDLALAIDCIPNKDEPAKDLGVWGVAAFIGSAVGPGVWAFLFWVCGRQVNGDYTTVGYTVMFFMAVGITAWAGIFIKFIKAVR